MKILTLLALLLLAAPAFAQGPHVAAPRVGGHTPPTVLDAAALSSTQTFNINEPGLASYSEILLWFFYDHTSAGTLAFTCTYNYDGAGTTDYVPFVTDGAASATLESSGVFTTASFSADTYGMFRLGILGVTGLECSVVHGATAGAITVRYSLVSQ